MIYIILLFFLAFPAFSADSLLVRREASLALDDSAFAMTIEDDLAYICMKDKIAIVDFSFIERPYETFSLDFGISLTDIEFGEDGDDSLIFVADKFSGIHILRKYEPYEEISSSFTYSNQTAISILGNKAYSCGGIVSIIDFVPLESPYITGTIEVIENTVDILYDGENFLITDLATGLNIVSPSAPLSPIISHIDFPNAQGVALDGDIAAATSSTDGLMIVDISNPKFPEVITRFDDFALYKPVQFNRPLVFAASEQGFEIFYNRLSGSCFIEGYYRNDRQITDIHLKDEYALVLEKCGKFVIYALDMLYEKTNDEISCSSHSLDVYPNPCRSHIKVHSKMDDLFTIYDIDGREITSQKIQENQQIKINFASGLPKGIYIIESEKNQKKQKFFKL